MAPARRPRTADAVFCFNDLLAIGALRAAAERGSGCRRPGGGRFDGTEESAYSLPSLTTVAPDKSAIAQRAVELVHRRIQRAGAFPPETCRPVLAADQGEHDGG